MKAEKVEELASKAAKKAIAARSKLAEFEDDDATDFDFGSSEASNIEESIEFDVFDYCESEYVKKGDFIEYTIKKNGSTVGFKKHPYSWEKIQKEFGGGRYNILAKSTTTGRIVKRQTCAVEDVLVDDKKDSFGFNPSDLVSQIAEAVKPKNDGPNFMELFTLMNSQQEKSRLEAERAAERARTESEKQTSTLVQLMQQNTMMMLEMMKSSQPKTDSTMEIARLVQSFSEKLENKFERALDKIQSTTKSPEFGLLDVLKLQQDAQDKGFKLYSQLNSIAEAKAEERIEMIEEYRENGSTSGEKKTMTDTLIETMLPTIAGALAQTKVQAQPVQQRVSRPQPRGEVRHTQIGSSNTAGQRVPSNQARPIHQAQTQRVQASGETSRQTGRTAIGQGGQPVSKVGGLPKAAFSKKEVIIETQGVEVNQSEDFQAFRERASEIIVPVLAEHLIQKTDPKIAAGIAETSLLDNGITREEFLHKFPLSAILDLIKDFGPDTDALLWIEQTYANLEIKSDSSIR